MHDPKRVSDRKGDGKGVREIHLIVLDSRSMPVGMTCSPEPAEWPSRRASEHHQHKQVFAKVGLVLVSSDEDGSTQGDKNNWEQPQKDED